MIRATDVVRFTIQVRDLNRSEQFYTELLGMETVARHPGVGMVFMKAGDDYVILSQGEALIDPDRDPDQDDEWRVHPLHVDPEDYDESLEFLRENGVDILHEEDRAAGILSARQAYFHDPDRNVLEITESRAPGQRL